MSSVRSSQFGSTVYSTIRKPSRVCLTPESLHCVHTIYPTVFHRGKAVKGLRAILQLSVVSRITLFLIRQFICIMGVNLW